ncbi:MAG TPA: response regulator [Herpetosiphonaceae bacterium]
MADRILVVSDTQELLHLFQEILTEAGYEVALHAYAVQDLEPVRAVAPDLTVIDCAFGEEQRGWQLVQTLKLCEDTAATPILICAAAPEPGGELGQRLLDRGVSVLLKPFERGELVRQVADILGAARLAG